MGYLAAHQVKSCTKDDCKQLSYTCGWSPHPQVILIAYSMLHYITSCRTYSNNTQKVCPLVIIVIIIIQRSTNHHWHSMHSSSQSKQKREYVINYITYTALSTVNNYYYCAMHNRMPLPGLTSEHCISHTATSRYTDSSVSIYFLRWQGGKPGTHFGVGKQILVGASQAWGGNVSLGWEISGHHTLCMKHYPTKPAMYVIAWESYQ